MKFLWRSLLHWRAIYRGPLRFPRSWLLSDSSAPIFWRDAIRGWKANFFKKVCKPQISKFSRSWELLFFRRSREARRLKENQARGQIARPELFPNMHSIGKPRYPTSVCVWLNFDLSRHRLLCVPPTWRSRTLTSRSLSTRSTWRMPASK